jgi:hypothetical protein
MNVILIIIKQVLNSFFQIDLEEWSELTIFASITVNINILPLLYLSASSARYSIQIPFQLNFSDILSGAKLVLSYSLSVSVFTAIRPTVCSLAKWQVKRWLCGFALPFCQTDIPSNTSGEKTSFTK